MRVQLLSFVQLFAIPWIVAPQTPLSLDFPGRNTGVGSHLLLSGIFPIQGSKPCLLYWQVYYHCITRVVTVKCHRLGGQTTEMFWLTVLEAGRLRASCLDCFLLRVVRKTLSHSSRLASYGLLAILHFLAYRRNTLTPPFIFI